MIDFKDAKYYLCKIISYLVNSKNLMNSLQKLDWVSHWIILSL